MQDVIAERRRRAVARDQRVGIERDLVGALVHHLVFDGEQIFVVDLDGAAEFDALAVVVGQRHRMGGAQRAGARLRPHCVRAGHLDGAADGVGPAEFGVERLRAAGRRQQHDRRRLRVDRFAELDQRQVVDAAALEVDRALQAVGRDLHARGGFERRLAVGGNGGWRLRRLAGSLAGHLRWGCARSLRHASGRRLARLLLLRLLLLLLLGLQFLLPRLLLRPGIEKLPSNQYDSGKRNGENGIFIIGHPNAVLSLRPACTRCNAPSNSAAIRANGTLSAARRPIST